MCQKKASTVHSKQTWPDWAALYPDLLYIIFKKFCDITDLIMFRAVCKAWRDATNLSESPSQFPCLIDWPYIKGSILRIYSPVSKRSHIFQVPNTLFYGLSGSDVILRSDMWNRSDQSNIYFSYLNPLTRVKKKTSSGGPFSKRRSRVVKFVIKHVGGSLCVWCYKQSERSMFLKVFDKTRSALCYRKRITFPNKGFGLNYLIKTTGHLLVVSVSIPEYNDDLNNCHFEVHRLDNYRHNPHWTKLSGIGDAMLFLDYRNCFSLTAKDYSGVKGNCIYFITCKNSQFGTKHVIGRFDMGLNKVEELSGPDWFDMGQNLDPMYVAWFVPSL